MDDEIDKKLQELSKFIPFVDLLARTEKDKQKSAKYADIKNWIIIKRRLCMEALNKIEDVLIKQYKNLLASDVKLTDEITNLFIGKIRHEYVNLCSDDEDDESGAQKIPKEQNNTQQTAEESKKNQSTKNVATLDDDDDDIEIVSVTTITNEEAKSSQTNTTNGIAEADIKKDSSEPTEDLKDFFDQESYDLLMEIDNNDDVKQEVVFQRRTSSSSAEQNECLFKRRDDFKQEKLEQEVVVESNVTEKNSCKKRSKSPKTTTADVISLDSSSDEEMDLISDNRITSTTKEEVVIFTATKTAVTSNCENSNSNSITFDEDIENDLNEVASELDEVASELNETTKISAQANTDNTELTQSHKSAETDNMNKIYNLVDFKLMNRLKKAIASFNSREPSSTSNNNVADVPNDDNIRELLPPASPTTTTIPSSPILPHPQYSTQQQQQHAAAYQSLPSSSLPVQQNIMEHHQHQHPGHLQQNIIEHHPGNRQQNIKEHHHPQHSGNQQPTIMEHHPVNLQQNIREHHPTHPGNQQQYIIEHQHRLSNQQQLYNPKYILHEVAQIPYAPTNSIPSAAFPNQQKINLNDPRIKKTLKLIENTPLANQVQLNLIPQQQQQQRTTTTPSTIISAPQSSQSTSQKKSSLLTFKSADGKTHSKMTYGEWSRHRERLAKEAHEAQLKKIAEAEEEKKRIAEEKIKAEKRIQEENLKKMIEDLREEEERKRAQNAEATQVIAKILRESPEVKSLEENNDELRALLINKINAYVDNIDALNTRSSTPPQPSSSKETETRAENSKKPDKMDKLYNELHCSLKGYDQIHDYIPKTIGNKRRSSLSASSAITNMLNNDCAELDENSKPKTIGSKRRSSVNARSAISAMLNNDCAELDQTKTLSNKRRSSVNARAAILDSINKDCAEPSCSTQSSQNKRQKSASLRIPKRRKTIDGQMRDKCASYDTDSDDNEDAKAQQKEIDKMTRVYNGLRCTVKGYEHIQDYVPQTVCSKRRSSISARSAIAVILNDDNVNLPVADQATGSIPTKMPKLIKMIDEPFTSKVSTSKKSTAKKAIAKKRTSGVCTSAAASSVHTDIINETWEQLISPTRKLQTTKGQGRKKNTASLKTSTISYVISSSDDDYDVESMDDEATSPSPPPPSNKPNWQPILKNQPFVWLTKLTENDIRKHSFKKNKYTTAKTINPSSNSSQLQLKLVEEESNPLNNSQLQVKLVEEKSSPAKMAKRPVGRPKCISRTKLNNDCEMTERNTRSCVLCTSKPSNITLHYSRKHKCESYVSRFTWTELDDLSLNRTFAKRMPRSSSARCPTRYKVACPFCSNEIVEQFCNLYNHFSSHTGEYAYQCSSCGLLRPYRADIESHQSHAKTECRNAHTQILYRYPKDAMVIYLYICKICNFVQLNEANILKHLREHHNPREANVGNLDKCILTAINVENEEISNSPPTSSSSTLVVVEQQEIVSSISNERQLLPVALPQPIQEEVKQKIKNDDDEDVDSNIQVCNEPCTDDLYDFSDGDRLEDALKALHGYSEDMESSQLETDNLNEVATSSNNSALSQRHLPMIIKMEPIFTEDNSAISANQTTISIAEILAKVDTDNATPAIALTISAITKRLNEIPLRYRTIPCNVNYFGLYKCMADDCYYSTDCDNEMLQHLINHSHECLPDEYLLCAYCIPQEGECTTPQELVQHIQSQHKHMIYQCSVCSYRSCEASNVRIHQKKNHTPTLAAARIYRCGGTDLVLADKLQRISEHVKTCIQKISCKYCHKVSFYDTNMLKAHIKTVHKLSDDQSHFSCIYCIHPENDQQTLKLHYAIRHPGELPYMCSHSTAAGRQEIDSIENLNLIYASESVPIAMIQPTLDKDNEEQINVSTQPMEQQQQQPLQDVKPCIDDMCKMMLETIKIRLRKLTNHTGVAPDSLYRCPQQDCGGFFTLYETWLKHVKCKHNLIVCPCPHCPSTENNVMRPPEHYALHFEEHVRCTYLCFHCNEIFRNKNVLQEHVSAAHSDLGEMRLEKISLNFPYYIMIQKTAFTERMEFLLHLQDKLNESLKDMELQQAKRLQTEWQMDTSKADYLNLSDGILKQLQNRAFTVLYICCACAQHSFVNHMDFAAHISESHAARDVPIIRLKQCNGIVKAGFLISFAMDHITFSTMRNCFCCKEKNMRGDNFVLHLRRYHKLSLNYSCAFCDLHLASLQLLQEHFKSKHPNDKLKIRCELASAKDLTLISACSPFQLCIQNDNAALPMEKVYIKSEPNTDGTDQQLDDSVILLDANDEEIQKALKANEMKEIEKPKLKLVPLGNLLDPQLENFKLPRDTIIFKESDSIQQSNYSNNKIPVLVNGQLDITKTANVQHPISTVVGFHGPPNLNNLPATAHAAVPRQNAPIYKQYNSVYQKFLSYTPEQNR